MTYGPTTALVCTDLALGWHSALDLTCTLSPVDESADIRRTWNGKAVNLAAAEFRLFAVEIASGESEMRAPALGRLWPGSILWISPTVDLGEYIAVGETSITLQRTPLAGSVRCLTLGFEDVAHTVDGDVVTLAAPATGAIRVYYRPVLECIVTEPWSISDRKRRAEVSWSFRL